MVGMDFEICIIQKLFISYLADVLLILATVDRATKKGLEKKTVM